MQTQSPNPNPTITPAIPLVAESLYFRGGIFDDVLNHSLIDFQPGDIDSTDIIFVDDDFEGEDCYIPYRKGQLWGYCDMSKRILIDCVFDLVMEFENDLAIVKRDGFYGVINTLGDVVIPTGYDYVGIRHDFIRVSLGCVWDEDEYGFVGGKWGVFSEHGQCILPVIYDLIYNQGSPYFNVMMNGKWGLIDLMGAVVLDLKYDSTIAVYKKATSDEVIFETTLDGKKVFWDSDFRTIDLFANDLAYIVCNGKLCAFAKEGDKMGLLDRFGNVIIPFEYDEVIFLFDSFFRVKQHGEYGLVDIDGAIVIPVEYDEVLRYGDFFCKVKQHGEYGIVNTEGVVIIPCRFDEIYYVDENFFAAYVGKKVTLIKTNGEVLFEPKYSDFLGVIDMAEFVFMKKVGEDGEGNPIGKCGIVDYNDNEIIPFEYDYLVGFYYDNICIAQIDGKSFAIDRQGKELFPERYDEMNDYCGGYSIVYNGEKTWACQLKSEGKYGVINKKGEVVVPLKYDNLFHSRSLPLLYIYNNEKKGLNGHETFGYLDYQGNEFWED